MKWPQSRHAVRWPPVRIVTASKSAMASASSWETLVIHVVEAAVFLGSAGQL